MVNRSEGSGGGDQVRFAPQGKKRLAGATAAFNESPSDMPYLLLMKRLVGATAAFNHELSAKCRAC